MEAQVGALIAIGLFIYFLNTEPSLGFMSGWIQLIGAGLAVMITGILIGKVTGELRARLVLHREIRGYVERNKA
jgi:hypothetical protein